MGRGLKLLLALSLAFNLFFALGFVRATWTLRRLRTPTGRAALVATRLDLDPQQRQHRDRLLERARAEVRSLERSEALRAEYWAELAGTPPDPQRLHELVDRSAAAHTQARHAAVDYMVDFLAVLRPEQRREFLDVARRTTVLDQQ